jgi:hypothetical protein
MMFKALASASEPVVQITCSTGEFLLTDLRLEATN